MVKPITEYTKEELEEKIMKIKAERERTANALKRYEEELEKRKQEMPLGVPAERRAYKEAYFVNCTGRVIDQPLDSNDSYDKEIFDMLDVFTSEASAQKHVEMLLAWRMTLVANAKGEQIDIKVLLPLLKNGWVAMDKNGSWCWYEVKPKHGSDVWTAEKPASYLTAFNIKPAEDWRESLMECGL